MGEILVHEFMTLDGIVDAPTWTFDFGFDPKMGEAIKALTERSRAILLGRTTYEMFEPAWSARTVDDDPGAPFFNDTQKYVVSSRLRETTWRNSTVLGPYDPKAIRRLKRETAGDVYVSGSAMLVRAMLADLLVLVPLGRTDYNLQHRIRSESPDGRHSELAYRRRLVRQLQLRGSLSVHLCTGAG